LFVKESVISRRNTIHPSVYPSMCFLSA